MLLGCGGLQNKKSSGRGAKSWEKFGRFVHHCSRSLISNPRMSIKPCGPVCFIRWLNKGCRDAHLKWRARRLQPGLHSAGQSFREVHFFFSFFPKQFTVGVLNATLDLAALLSVGVVGFLGSEVVLSPVVSGCLPSCGGWVLVGVVGFLGSEVVLSPVVSGCLPSCGGWVLVGVAASRTKTFRNQNHRFQSKFAYCKLFGVYAGVIWSSKVREKMYH